jgi:hypothetical protein
MRLLTALLLAFSASAADYHLSLAGDDSHDGLSPTTAWKSLDRASRQLYASADRLLLRAGDTFPGSLLVSGGEADPQRPLVITSFGEGRARIHSSTSTAIQIKDRGAVSISDLTLTGAGYSQNRGYGIDVVNTLPNAAKLKGVRIERVEASGFWHAGIFVGGRPADKSQSGFEDVVIADCNTHNNIYYGVLVDGVWDANSTSYANRNVTVERCVFHHNTGDPAFIDNHSGSGIKLDDTDLGAIRHSVAYENGAFCHSRDGGPCGIWTHGSNRITIENNLSYRNRTGNAVDGCGFDFDAGVTNSILQNNISFDNDGAGYLLFTYKPAPHKWDNNIVRNNLSQYDAKKNKYSGIYIENYGTGITNLLVENNRILVRPSLIGGDASGIFLSLTNGVTLRGNTIVSAGAAPIVKVTDTGVGATWENNVWLAEDGKFSALVAGEEAKSEATLERLLNKK